MFFFGLTTILVLIVSFIFCESIEQFPTDERRKYILIWTPHGKDPKGAKWPYGHLFFRERECQYKNCYVAFRQNMSLEKKVEKYDAILFNSVDIMRFEDYDFPVRTSPNQRYVFVSYESADRVPLCNDYYDDFFNWTMTYRLDSDIPDPYFTVHDLNGKKVGPDANMEWKSEANMLPINDDFKVELSKKKKLAAWFVSHCNVRSERKEFVMVLQKNLKKYNFGMHNQIDIYGDCGLLQCRKNESEKCFKMVEKDYVFYMAMENTFAVDYVTEKVMIALNNKAIPIVYGGADYNRFLPPGSYIDARSLGPQKLAKKMFDVIKNPSALHEYFKWHNHYLFQNYGYWSPGLCRLCAALNQNVSTQSYDSFLTWWNERYRSRCGRHLRLTKRKSLNLTQTYAALKNTLDKKMKHQENYINRLKDYL